MINHINIYFGFFIFYSRYLVIIKYKLFYCSEVKFYLITNIFSIIFFLFITNVNAKECDKIWLIENLEVREINNDPSLVKQMLKKKYLKLLLKN